MEIKRDPQTAPMIKDAGASPDQHSGIIEGSRWYIKITPYINAVLSEARVVQRTEKTVLLDINSRFNTVDERYAISDIEFVEEIKGDE